MGEGSKDIGTLKDEVKSRHYADRLSAMYNSLTTSCKLSTPCRAGTRPPFVTVQHKLLEIFGAACTKIIVGIDRLLT
jgi:hypothetical protein